MKVFLLTTLAMVAFAANSVLCRYALGANGATGLIDATSFTVVRLGSGAVVLLMLHSLLRQQHHPASRGSWWSALMLFTYAAGFSFAYLQLDTATGALVLFGVVQLTMLLVSLARGSRPGRFEWFGLLLSCAGFGWLMLPGATSPPVAGFLIMGVAGIAWGIYSLLGKGSGAPLADTTWNFVRTLPMIALLALAFWSHQSLSVPGVALAMASGAIASGLGYAIWYSALPALSATEAGVVQLTVPVIAAFGGLLIAQEPITLRVALASLLILGGVLMVILARRPAAIAPCQCTHRSSYDNRG